MNGTRLHATLCLIFGCLTLLLPATASGDEVHLASDKVLKGDLSSTAEGVLVKAGRNETRVGWGEIDWIVVRSKGFVFRSRVTPEKTRYYVEAFERFSKALADTFKFKVKLRKNWTAQIRIFRDREGLRKYQLDTEGVISDVYGYFRVDPENWLEEVVVLDLPRDPGETFDTLLHESTHMMLYLWGKAKNFSFPSWIDEGLAEYFGGSAYRPDARSKKRVFTQGLQKPWRLDEIRRQIRNNTVEPLDTLLLTPPEGFQGVHYSHAWSLIHFIAHHDKGRYARRLNRYCRDLMRTVREGERTVELFEKMFKTKVGELEMQWRKYVMAMKPVTAADRLALADTLEWKGKGDEGLEVLKPLLEASPDDHRALEIRARLLLHKRQYKQALEVAKRVLALQPDYPQGLYTHAVACVCASKWAESLAGFEAYAKVDPFHLEAAIFRLQCLLCAPKKLRNPGKARSIGERLATYHNDAELHALIGDACVQLGDFTSAVDRYEKALALNPRDRSLEIKLKKAKAKR